MTTPFRTLRLIGRPPAPSDAALYRMLFAGEGPDRLAHDLQEYERHALSPWVLRHAGRDVGVAGFRIGFGGEGMELSFHFLPETWGQGLASEFVVAAMDYALAVLQEDRFFGVVETPQSASARVLEKAGFTMTGARPEGGWLMERRPDPPRSGLRRQAAS